MNLVWEPIGENADTWETWCAQVTKTGLGWVAMIYYEVFGTRCVLRTKPFSDEDKAMRAATKEAGELAKKEGYRLADRSLASRPL